MVDFPVPFPGTQSQSKRPLTPVSIFGPIRCHGVVTLRSPTRQVRTFKEGRVLGSHLPGPTLWT